LIVENTNLNEKLKTDQNQGDFSAITDFYTEIEADSSQ